MSCLKIVDRCHHFSSLDLKDHVNTRSRCVSLLPSPFTLTMFLNFLIPQFPVDGLDWNSFNMFEGWFWTYGNAIYVLVSIKLRFFRRYFICSQTKPRAAIFVCQNCILNLGLHLQHQKVIIATEMDPKSFEAQLEDKNIKILFTFF